MDMMSLSRMLKTTKTILKMWNELLSNKSSIVIYMSLLDLSHQAQGANILTFHFKKHGNWIILPLFLYRTRLPPFYSISYRYGQGYTISHISTHGQVIQEICVIIKKRVCVPTNEWLGSLIGRHITPDILRKPLHCLLWVICKYISTQFLKHKGL